MSNTHWGLICIGVVLICKFIIWRINEAWYKELLKINDHWFEFTTKLINEICEEKKPELSKEIVDEAHEIDDGK